MCQVKIKKITANARLPVRQTQLAVGFDLHACLSEKVILQSGERKLLPTGISLEMPAGMEAQIRPRSGLAWKNGLTILNTPGTIDPDYRGEICVILINLSDTEQIIKNGDRIAQMVFNRVEIPELIETDMLSDTERDKGGFGHTG